MRTHTAKGWVAGIVSVCLAWLIAARVASPYVLPGPATVLRELSHDAALYGLNTLVTALEALLGLFVAVILSAGILISVGLFPRSEAFFYPYTLMIKATPAVAFAPVFVVLVGTGIWCKVLVSAMIAFFPLVISGIDGFAAAPDRLTLMARGYGASRAQRLIRITAPYSIFGFFTGLKTAAPLAIVGAIVGEYVAGGSPAGLGTLIMSAHGSNNVTGVFSCAVLATILGLAFFGSAHLGWQLMDARLHVRK
jgi:NitT/TauT family transport system permease protein